MRLTDSRIAARRSIVFQNALYVLVVPFVLFFSVCQYFSINMPLWLVLIFILIVQPIALFLLTRYRLRINHDGRILEKWQEQYKKEISASKAEIEVLNSEIQEDSYGIRSIYPVGGKVAVFRIVFFVSKIYRNAVPVITLDGVRIASNIVGNSEIICYGGKAINSKKQHLTFRSGTLKYVVGNPYYISGDIPSRDIIWQCEGHTYERTIFIPAMYFPNKNPSVSYALDLLANGVKLGTYSGFYIVKIDMIIVKIGSIAKRQCVNKECILRPTFDISKKILLPKPSVIFINGKITSTFSMP